jgi:hypothetical protein
MFSINHLIAIFAEESPTTATISQQDANKLTGSQFRHHLPSHTHLADSCHIHQTIVDLALAQRLLRLLSESGRQLLAAFTRAHHVSCNLSWKEGNHFDTFSRLENQCIE